jgi:hypothetical protein
MQGGCEIFLSGASDHCTSTRRERRRKIFCKADAGDFLNIVLNYYNHFLGSASIDMSETSPYG